MAHCIVFLLSTLSSFEIRNLEWTQHSVQNLSSLNTLAVQCTSFLQFAYLNKRLPNVAMPMFLQLVFINLDTIFILSAHKGLVPAPNYLPKSQIMSNLT